MNAWFVHNIDPIVAQLGPLNIWFYGLSYTLGFLEMHLWILHRARERLGLSLQQCYGLTLSIVLGVLLGGRLLEVLFYERPFYSAHPALIPAVWLGGMCTHGILLGAVVGAWLFARRYGKPLLAIADELAVPAALLMGLGRIGNFIDGQIVGEVTNVWWGVRFPDAEGFRHPVVLYDGLKNILLVPLLLGLRRRRPAPGVVFGVFVLLYAALRIGIDVFREYPTTLLGLATGQSFNLVMTAAGIALLVLARRPRAAAGAASAPAPARGLGWQKAVLALLLLVAATMPSDWTQDVPARYGRRHAGLAYSWLYPRLPGAAPAPRPATATADAEAGARWLAVTAMPPRVAGSACGWWTP